MGRSDEFSAYLVQLRPAGGFPSACPQGQQYQLLVASQYGDPRTDATTSVVFQFLGSTVNPPSGAQAAGEFTTLLAPTSTGVCSIPTLTSATDDSATPVNASSAVGSTTYTFSEMEVLSDAAHRGRQFQARTVVDYGMPGCEALEYVAQAVFPITPCLNDSICLPEQVATDLPAPAGRGIGSQIPPDNRVFCNLDPALLDNPEMASLLGYFGAGRGAYEDAAGLHDVGVCFFSEPFPSLCPAGSTLSTTGPCVVGPGSNPH
ncbi:MAG TPA: hypothetical protein VLA89_15430 [Gemmatimonadales bacterium]|nr:hypothetical protein [Gemmatimonadales bacterium]